MRKRTRVINFDAEFVPKPTKANQYKIDPDLTKKFSTIWKNEFFTYIVNCAIDYLKSDNKALIAPKCIDEEKNSYFNNMDYIGKALNERFEFTKNPKDKVLRSDLKAFYELSCQEQEKPYSPKKLLEYLIVKLGEARKTSGLNEDGKVVKGDYFHVGIKYRDVENKEVEEVEDVQELKDIIKKQAKQIEELMKLLEAKNAVPVQEIKEKIEEVEEEEELNEDDLDELFTTFNKKIEEKKPLKFVGKSKVVIEDDEE
jgi:hypothetical protein